MFLKSSALVNDCVLYKLHVPHTKPDRKKPSGCSAKTGADKKRCSTATNHSRVIKEQPRFHLTVFLAELLSETL